MRGLAQRAKFDPEIIGKRRRAAAALVTPELCPKCEQELREDRYHDCGEQVPLFDAEPYRKYRRRR